MTVGVPAALAVVGTTLAAIAAFGPFRAKPQALAPPPASPHLPSSGPTWPALVEPTALACDTRVRIDLAEALGRLQSPWSEAILREAHVSEPDPTVRAAIAAALETSRAVLRR